MITTTDPGRLVAHVADALSDPTYPDAEYLRQNLARVLATGTRKGRRESARGIVIWTVFDALKGEHGDYVRAEVARVLRDDALRLNGVRGRVREVTA